MARIATLGSVDPFASDAAEKFKASAKEIDGIDHLSSVRSVFRAVGNQCAYGVVPFENLVEGHVVPVLELLLQGNSTVIDEKIVPARFGFVANCRKLSELTLICTTFRSRSECSEFITTLSGVTLQTVIDSCEARKILSESNQPAGAIVPSWEIRPGCYPLTIENISDYKDNITRYIVLAEQEQKQRPDKAYKTLMVILEAEDRPGVLNDILTAFSSRSINLTSIISRPTREHIGTYHFFIDCDGHVFAPDMQEALSEIKKWCHVKLLGSYPRADFVSGNRETVLPGEIASLRVNPLRPSGRSPRIAITAGRGPYRNTLDALSNFNLSSVHGARVLLKPNIGRYAEPYSGVVTNPQVVAAAIDAFQAAGADVAIGESPIVGVNMNTAFEKSGIRFIADERNCPCIDMDRRKPVEIAIRDGVAIKKLQVCADIFDFDIIVSIPVMKTHMHTVATLSVKNMKGCLWRRSKVELHMLPRLPFIEDKSLNVAIADMASVLRPHLSIIDGTVGMEGLGPSAGEPKSLDLVIAGNDALAADTAACTIMGIDPKDVPHLRIAAERGYGSIDPDSFSAVNPEWGSLRSPFAPVPYNLTMQFPGVTILDEQSCSACQSTVMLFLKRYADQLGEYFPGNKKITIAIGKGHEGVPPNTVCVGNCIRRFRDTGVHVPGCPPVASTILDVLKKQKEKQQERQDEHKP